MDVDDLDDATLVAGAPRSGKTRFALDMLVAAMKRHGDAYAVMTVSGRQVADRLGDTVIRETVRDLAGTPRHHPASRRVRIMTAVRSHAGQPLPKLLNGAEQDVVIRRVLAKPCRTWPSTATNAPPAHYLRTYFVVADWSGMVVDDATDAFANQLRDMLARMNEIGAKTGTRRRADFPALPTKHGTLDETTRTTARAMAARLRAARRIQPGHQRGISGPIPSRRLAAHDRRRGRRERSRTSDLPKLVIVDDFQDATLAGFDFLTALRNRGVRLLLVGNPDEAVQTFRGSYPEYFVQHGAIAIGRATGYGWNRPIWPKARTWLR